MLTYTSTHAHTLTDTDQNFYFTNDLRDYYYAYEGLALLIRCEAVEQRDDSDSVTAVHATVFKDSDQINMYDPPERHQVLADSDGIANGLLIVPSLLEDSGSIVRCAIIRDGQEVATTSDTTLYVGGKSLVIIIWYMITSVWKMLC